MGINGKLLTGTALAPFGCEEVVIWYGEREYRSSGELIVPKLPAETMKDEQEPSGSGRVESETKKNNKTVSWKSHWSNILTKRERMMTKPQLGVRQKKKRRRTANSSGKQSNESSGDRLDRRANRCTHGDDGIQERG